jgi:hypothetical protein
MPTTEHRPEGDPYHRQHVIEHHFSAYGAIITIVASLSYMSREDPELVTEWRAYWLAFSERLGDEDWRREEAARRGEKLLEDVARAMFPHIQGWYAH